MNDPEPILLAVDRCNREDLITISQIKAIVSDTYELCKTVRAESNGVVDKIITDSESIAASRN
jgi:hypothetical protein